MSRLQGGELSVLPRAEHARGGYEIEGVARLLGYQVPPGMAEDLQSIAEKLIASRLRPKS